MQSECKCLLSACNLLTPFQSSFWPTHYCAGVLHTITKKDSMTRQSKIDLLLQILKEILVSYLLALSTRAKSQIRDNLLLFPWVAEGRRASLGKTNIVARNDGHPIPAIKPGFRHRQNPPSQQTRTALACLLKYFNIFSKNYSVNIRPSAASALPYRPTPIPPLCAPHGPQPAGPSRTQGLGPSNRAALGIQC